MSLFKTLFTKENIKYLLIGLTGYCLLSIPLKFIFAENAQSLAFWPVVLGMLGGPAAAVGVASGSLISDFCVGTVLYVTITTAITVFFQAYVPYKLWYTLKPLKKAEHFLYDGATIIKFIYIALLSSLLTTSMMVMILDSVRMATAEILFFTLFLKDLDSVLLLGTPLLVLLSNGWIRPFIPKIDAKHTGSGKYDALLYGVILTGISYVYLSKYANGETAAYIAFFVWVGMFLSLSFFMQKTINYELEASTPIYLMKNSLYASIIWLYIFIVFLFLGFVVSIAYQNAPNRIFLETAEMLRMLAPSISIVVHLLFLLIVFFLWRMERKFMKFLTRTSVEGESMFALRSKLPRIKKLTQDVKETVPELKDRKIRNESNQNSEKKGTMCKWENNAFPTDEKICAELLKRWIEKGTSDQVQNAEELTSARKK